MGLPCRLTPPNGLPGVSGIPCVGKTRTQGVQRCPAANNLPFRTPFLINCLTGRTPRTAFNPDGILDALKKALAERMLNAEMDQHLSSEASDGRANTRNGYGQKTVLTDTGRLALDIPRDRQGTFDPQLIAKYQRRFSRLRRQDRLPLCAGHEIPSRSASVFCASRRRGRLRYVGTTPPAPALV